MSIDIINADINNYTQTMDQSHLQSNGGSNSRTVLVFVVKLQVADKHLINTTCMTGWQAVKFALEKNQQRQAYHI